VKAGRGRSPFLAAYAAAALSAAYLLLALTMPSPSPAARAEIVEASRLMARATAAVKDCRVSRGIAIDPSADPNGTGLIGVEQSAITTSAGRLEAKRTTTDPAFAGLVASLLREAGVRRGDVVAVGASSSFPALIVATLAAAKVMGVEPLVISSLGASQWGANVAEFTWLGMEECLRRAGLIDVVPIARSVGGEGDGGRDMDPSGRSALAGEIRAGRAPFIQEPDLERNVARRMALYREHAGPRPIKAFINVGGSWANLGTDAEVLKLEPGLARDVFIPPPSRRGVIQAMAAAGVPVIHLLNVKGLCERYGLPWDPRPLPLPDETGSPASTVGRGTPPALLTAAYIALVAAVLLGNRRRRLSGIS
jgi:poly-gamma-glutamate system protein